MLVRIQTIIPMAIITKGKNRFWRAMAGLWLPAEEAANRVFEEITRAAQVD
jgi:hypothetical protein